MIPPMKYLKASQFVPDKGEAWMIYECEDDGAIRRFVTYITGTGEATRNARPVVKRLYRPEMCQPSTAEEFQGLWDTPGARDAGQAGS